MTQRRIRLQGRASRSSTLREWICLGLIWAIAFVPVAHADELGRAPQATLYVAVPFQAGNAARPEFGLRFAYDSVVHDDPKYSTEPARIVDFRLQQENDASVLRLNGVPLNAKPSGGLSKDTTFWIIVGVAIGVAAILIISSDHDCNPKPGHPC